MKEGMGESKQADIAEILNYRRAMAAAVKEMKKLPLCLNLVKKLHAILLDSVRGRNRPLGEFRRVQNFIGPSMDIKEATFIPPSPEKVLPAMGNWEKYLHYEEKDRLVQLAIAKGQFELIHPFLNGNGRIGRMLLPLFLYEKGLLSSPMFYLSAYFEGTGKFITRSFRVLSGTRTGTPGSGSSSRQLLSSPRLTPPRQRLSWSFIIV